MSWSTGLLSGEFWVFLTLDSRLKLEEYVIPMKWASFLGECALLVFLPLNIYVMNMVRKTLGSPHCTCSKQTQGLSGSIYGMGMMESENWEFILLFAILGAHCVAGHWLCMAIPPRIYYNER